MNKKALILTLALALPASLTLAQRPGGPPPGGQPPGGLPPHGPAPGRYPPGPTPDDEQSGGSKPQFHGKRPPKDNGEREQPQPGKPPLAPIPLLRVLDADHDGIISAAEIENAPEALLKLDKNKDGKLMPDEYLSPQPQPQPPPQPPVGPPPGNNRERGIQNPRKPGEGERPFPGQKPPRQGETKPAGPGEAGPPPAGAPNDQGEPHRPPVPPIVAALDVDHNGVISADEIANAAKSLLTLDKNNDGQLGPGEYMGHPPGEHHEGDGPIPPREGAGPKPPGPAPAGQ